MPGKHAGLALTVLLLALAAYAQTPNPSVTFIFDFPGSQPDHYMITVDSEGRSHYESDGKLNAEAENDPYQTDFTVTPEFRSRVFDLAKRTHYFGEAVDSKKTNIASTGTKTLEYNDGHRVTKATYNYSPRAPIQELTSLFQAVAATLEFGHRLQYYYRYQKLALADELKRMEDMQKDNSLQQLGAVSEILTKIANDQTVINPVRVRAERLLAKAGAGPSR